MQLKLLALETATDACSVALWQDGECLEQYALAPRRQTELVLPMIDQLLAAAGCARTQLDAIAFGRGPGAFTGVRVAVAVAQGIGFALQRPLIGISTLAACGWSAQQRGGDGHWLVALDARMGELYLAGYHCQGDHWQCLLEEAVVAPTALPALPALAWRGAGSGALHLAAMQARWPTLGDWYDDIGPRAAAVAALAARQPTQQWLSAADAQPTYLRDRVIQGAIR